MIQYVFTCLENLKESEYNVNAFTGCAQRRGISGTLQGETTHMQVLEHLSRPLLCFHITEPTVVVPHISRDNNDNQGSLAMSRERLVRSDKIIR